MAKRKPTHDDKIRMQIYTELLKEKAHLTGIEKIPTLQEIDQRYKEKYGY